VVCFLFEGARCAFNYPSAYSTLRGFSGSNSQLFPGTHTCERARSAFYMPAAGKCRKGVFSMKKLLLVMLVPVLVLGLFSCGKVQDMGDPMALGLHGSWLSGKDNDTVLVLSGNQASLYSISDNLKTATYRIVAPVPGDEAADGSLNGDIEFYGFFDTKAELIATITFSLNAAGTSLNITQAVREDNAVSYYLPEVATYTKK